MKLHRATRRMLVFGFDTIEMNEDVLVCGHCLSEFAWTWGIGGHKPKWCSVSCKLKAFREEETSNIGS